MLKVGLIRDGLEFRDSNKVLNGRHVFNDVVFGSMLSLDSISVTIKCSSTPVQDNNSSLESGQQPRIVSSWHDFFNSIDILFFFAPDFNDLIPIRDRFNPRVPICGINHTLASYEIRQRIGTLLRISQNRGDAIIAASSASRRVLDTIFHHSRKMIKDQFGCDTRVPRLNVRTVPLPIDSKFFKVKPNVMLRQSLNLSEAIVFCFVGRLSFHAKNDFAALYRCLSCIQKKTGKAVVLIECGWFANDYIQKALLEAKKALSPNVNHVHVDGREGTSVTDVLSVSDVFVSLSDNIQESYGLSPLEAMAAGLPVLASDWNGYKESIDHGTNGCKAATVFPNHLLSDEIDSRYRDGLVDYDHFIGHLSNHTAIDFESLVAHGVGLASDFSYRQKLGSAGREMARYLYSVDEVLPRYIEFWQYLVRLTDKLDDSHSIPSSHSTFKHFGTCLFQFDTALRICSYANLTEPEIEAILNLEIVGYGVIGPIEPSEMMRLYRFVEHETETNADAISKNLNLEPLKVASGVSLLLKLGLLSTSAIK